MWIRARLGMPQRYRFQGGSINGSLAFELDGTEWIYEQNFQSETAMDAAFSNNSNYTIALSGGSLGTLTQNLTMGAKAYPDLHYFIGNGFVALASFDPSVDFDFEFATPSSEADLTVIEIEETNNDQGDSPFDAIVASSQTTINMSANTLSGGKTYEGYADHVHSSAQSGVGASESRKMFIKRPTVVSMWIRPRLDRLSEDGRLEILVQIIRES